MDPLSVTVTPSTGLVDGQVVSVAFTGAASTLAAECDATALSDLSLAHLSSTCQFPGTLAASPAPLTLSQTFATVDGTRVHCSDATPCVVVVGPSSAGPFASAPISFVPQPLAVSPTSDLTDGQVVDAWVSAASGATEQLAQCALPVGATAAASRCGPSTPVVIPASGQAHLTPTVRASITTSGGVVDCHGSACAFAQFDATGTTVASVPITIPRTPTMTLSPATGLTDGQAIHVTASNLDPGASVGFDRCGSGVSWYCEDITASNTTVAADGTLDTTVVASQRQLTVGVLGPGQRIYGYCRLGACSLTLNEFGTGKSIEFVPYGMAAGSLTATPSTGLADGQSVAARRGPTSCPPTSGRASGPSRRAAGRSSSAAPTSAPPPPSSPRSRAAASPAERASPPSPAPPTAPPSNPPPPSPPSSAPSPTAAPPPDTCVVGLVRFEQDGTVSTHLTPLTFAP